MTDVRDRAVLRSRAWVGAGSIVLLALAAPARAAAPPGEPAPAPVSAESPAASPTIARWIVHHRPTRDCFELGLFGGVFLPHRSHELYDITTVWQPYARVAPALGLRAAYFPLRFLGAEVEGAAMPVAIDSAAGGRAVLYAARGHLVGQLPLASVVPFVLIGGGALAARSDVLGSDIDLVSHFGGGLKLFVHRYVGLRLDVRGTVTSRVGNVGGRIVHPELLLGVIIPLNVRRDSDDDGLYDPGQRARPVDACPHAPGALKLRGCPDRDRDALADRDDRCPDVPGLAERRGCPPLRDGDGDGVFDPGQFAVPAPGGDECPEVAGRVERIGCPEPDHDGTGVVDVEDRCLTQGETFNGFQDEDGCPDELPLDVAAVIGTLRGIKFAFLSDKIRAGSRPALDHAVGVLRAHPMIRVEIQGHTDADGDHALNLALSLRRAEAVLRYFTAAGVVEGRLRAVGHGGDRPISDNKTAAGKAQNRRIELHLIDADDRVITAP